MVANLLINLFQAQPISQTELHRRSMPQLKALLASEGLFDIRNQILTYTYKYTCLMFIVFVYFYDFYVREHFR